MYELHMNLLYQNRKNEQKLDSNLDLNWIYDLNLFFCRTTWDDLRCEAMLYKETEFNEIMHLCFVIAF